MEKIFFKTALILFIVLFIILSSGRSKHKVEDVSKPESFKFIKYSLILLIFNMYDYIIIDAKGEIDGEAYLYVSNYDITDESKKTERIGVIIKLKPGVNSISEYALSTLPNRYQYLTYIPINVKKGHLSITIR